MADSIFFGDTHSHCDIAYGHGTLTAALKRARGQLDFCSVTGQAAWPDMVTTTRGEEYATLVERHNAAFAHFAACHEEAFRQTWAANEPGRFVTFPSYEVCGTEHGDHTILGNTEALRLQFGLTSREILSGHNPDDVIIYPHHLGYAPGMRGVNWEAFDEAVSPFVEIHSLHGCSESDDAPYPMQNAKAMSYRDGRSTASYGLGLGKRFGLVAGTDHHSAWPGSYGHGRMAVLAPDLTRSALWDAMKKRHVYALTGDNIRVHFRIGNGVFGDVVRQGGKREMAFGIEACDFIDTIDLLRNERQIWQARGRSDASGPPDEPMTAKVRIEWGRVFPEKTVDFEGKAWLESGDLIHVEPCFHGPGSFHVSAEHGEEPDLPHEITSCDDVGVSWRSCMFQSPQETLCTPQAILMTVRMMPSGSIVVKINGRKFTHRLEELLNHSVAHQLRGVHWEGIRICRAVPESCYRLEQTLIDDGSGRDVDFYRLRIRQTNNQYAWISPIWVER